MAHRSPILVNLPGPDRNDLRLRHLCLNILERLISAVLTQRRGIHPCQPETLFSPCLETEIHAYIEGIAIHDAEDSTAVNKGPRRRPRQLLGLRLPAVRRRGRRGVVPLNGP